MRGPLPRPGPYDTPVSSAARSPTFVRCARGALHALAVAAAVWARPALAHDLERTSVSLRFAPDGSFVLDVSNDPGWLTLRLQSVPGPFDDRVVVFVDGHEIRPTSVEYLPPPAGRAATSTGAVATYRLRGQLPLDAHTLRWYYGLVIDPYPLTVRRADGRIVVEEVAGDAWSREIDLSGQFTRTAYWPIVLLAGLLLAGVILRLRSAGR